MFLSNERDNKLKSAFELYNQRMIESLPTDEELSKISFSETFERKMKKLLSLQKKTYYKLINTVGKRVAIIVLTLIISLTATTFSVKALREAVIEFITETYEKFTRVSIEQDGPHLVVEFKKTQPKYIPDGFDITVEDEYDEFCRIVYRNSENIPICYSQQINNDSNFTTDTEGANFERIYINSLEGIMYSNKDFNKIVFGNEKYFFTLDGKIPMEELQKMAESIPLE